MREGECLSVAKVYPCGNHVFNMMNEQTVVNAARKMFGGRAGGRVRVGIGDDAAVVRIGRTDVVLTIDSVVEGVDFDFRYFTWTDVGFKAV